MVTQWHLRHELKLAWVVKSRDKDPLGVISQVIMSMVSNDVTKLLEVSTDDVEGLLVFVLLGYKATSAHYDGGQHTFQSFKELFKG